MKKYLLHLSSVVRAQGHLLFFSESIWHIGPELGCLLFTGIFVK